MPEITCSVVQDLLEAYLSGEVSEETAKLLAEHINHCPECASLARMGQTVKSRLKEARNNTAVKTPDPKRVVSRARRRILTNIALVLVVAVAFAALGLREVYSHSVAAPIRVQNAQQYAEKTIPGARLARALGLVTDYDLKVNEWLTVNSMYRLDKSLAAVVYTTTNGYKLNNVWSSQGVTTIWRDVGMTQGIGGISTQGHHFIAVLALPYPEVIGETYEFAAALTTPFRARRLLGQWSLRPQQVTSLPTNVLLEISKEFITASPKLSYTLDQTQEIAGLTVKFTGLEISQDQTRLLTSQEQPENGSFNVTLQLATKEGQQVRVTGQHRRIHGQYAETDYVFNPLPEVPDSVSILITHAHLQQPQSFDIAVPWSRYAGNGKEVIPKGERKSIHSAMGTVTLVGFDLTTNRLVFEVSNKNATTTKFPFAINVLTKEGQQTVSGASYIRPPRDSDAKYGISNDGLTTVWETDVRPEFVVTNPEFRVRITRNAERIDLNKTVVIDLPDPR